MCTRLHCIMNFAGKTIIVRYHDKPMVRAAAGCLCTRSFILTLKMTACPPAGQRKQGYMKQPQLIVFDLDFTLWDCDGTWCDCLSPPFRLRSGMVLDGQERPVQLYSDVRAVLDQCDLQNCDMALASRTEKPAWAERLIELLGIAHRFSYSEIYPSSKLKHFAELKEASNVEYQQMLFFDDEIRNITEVGSLGVCCIHVANGLNDHIFRQGLEQFQQEY